MGPYIKEPAFLKNLRKSQSFSWLKTYQTLLFRRLIKKAVDPTSNLLRKEKIGIITLTLEKS